MALEQVKDTGENTSNAEESTTSKQAEEASTVADTPTLSETPEFIEALAQKTSELQGGFDRRHTLLETRITQANAKAQEAVDKHTALMDDQAADNSLTSIIKRYEDSGGDAETVDGLAKALRTANQKTTEANRTMEQAVKKTHEVFLANKSLEVEKEYGIPKEELFGLETEDEMRIKGLEYQIANPKKLEVKKVDSATGAGAGIDWRNLSPGGKIKQGLGK